MTTKEISLEKLNEYVFNLRYRYEYIEVKGLCASKYSSIEQAIQSCKHPSVFFWMAAKLKIPTSMQLPILLEVLEITSGSFPHQNCQIAFDYMKAGQYTISRNEKVLSYFAYDPQNELINAVRKTLVKTLSLSVDFTGQVEVFARYIARDKQWVIKQSEIAKKLLLNK